MSRKFLFGRLKAAKQKDGRTGLGIFQSVGQLRCSWFAGSITDGGGYAFLMNSFDLAWPLPMVLAYDNHFAMPLASGC